MGQINGMEDVLKMVMGSIAGQPEGRVIGTAPESIAKEFQAIRETKRNKERELQEKMAKYAEELDRKEKPLLDQLNRRTKENWEKLYKHFGITEEEAGELSIDNQTGEIMQLEADPEPEVKVIGQLDREIMENMQQLDKEMAIITDELEMRAKAFARNLAQNHERQVDEYMEKLKQEKLDAIIDLDRRNNKNVDWIQQKFDLTDDEMERIQYSAETGEVVMEIE